MATRNYALTDDTEQFLNRYYKQDVADLASHYPQERKSLYIEAKDVFAYSPELLDHWIKHPDEVNPHMAESIEYVDIPLDMDLSDANARLIDTNGYLDRYGVGDLFSRHENHLIALRGRIGQVTGAITKLAVAAFECRGCGNIVDVPQPDTQFLEPEKCPDCSETTDLQINFRESEKIDQRKLKVEQPPHEQQNGGGQSITVYVHDDLIHVGGENGLPDRAGDLVTIIGEYKPDKTDLDGRNETPTYDCYFKAHSFVFDDDGDEDIEAEEYRETVEEYANRDNAIELFKHSIDPGLTITDKWDIATEMATAYLFGAPRIDPDDGDMVRGDIHMLFVSDPGMRKSVFAKQVAKISPRAELRQATGMASDVGLTSAAQQDDFGDGEWTLKPGALPRANGGHLILDEIDKGPGLGGIHDALAGSQELKVDKAGIQATLATRVGFLALGNPTEGRFDPHQTIPDQIDLDPALMSRFDLIVTMEDTPDERQDDKIAGGILESVDESSRMEYGDLASEDADAVNPDVPHDVMQAWVALAREEIQPLLTDEAKGILREYYVDTRQLNDDNSDTPPATARTLVGGIRLAMAFARAELSETVKRRHATRAKRLSKTVVGENFDIEAGVFDADRTTETPSSQQQRVDAIQTTLKRADEPLTIEEVADDTGIELSQVEHRVEKLYESGAIMEPETDKYRWVA